MLRQYLVDDFASTFPRPVSGRQNQRVGMSFGVFDSRTGDDVPTLPEQLLGRRWSESSLLGRLHYAVMVLGLSVLAIGMFFIVSAM